MKTELLDDPLDQYRYPVRPTWMVWMEVFLLIYLGLLLLVYGLIILSGLIEGKEGIDFLVFGILFGLPPSLFWGRLLAWRKMSKAYMAEGDPDYLQNFGPTLLWLMPLFMSLFWALGTVVGWDAIWNDYSPDGFVAWLICSLAVVPSVLLSVSIVQIRRKALALHQTSTSD